MTRWAALRCSTRAALLAQVPQIIIPCTLPVRPSNPPSISTVSRGKIHASIIAGWSSPVAREAHNLEVAGSNPVPATLTPA